MVEVGGSWTGRSKVCLSPAVCSAKERRYRNANGLGVRMGGGKEKERKKT